MDEPKAVPVKVDSDAIAAAILATDDLVRQQVAVPEWETATGGAPLFVRELTGEERGELEAEWSDGQGDLRTMRARLVAACLETEDGQPVFSDTQIAKLGRKSAAVLGRLADAILEISGLSAAIEEQAKN
jgi:hypothetical protein